MILPEETPFAWLSEMSTFSLPETLSAMYRGGWQSFAYPHS